MSEERTAFRIVGGPRDGFWFPTESAMRAVTDKMPALAQAELSIMGLAGLGRMYGGIPFRVATTAEWALLSYGWGEMTKRWRAGEDAATLLNEMIGGPVVAEIIACDPAT